MDFFKTARWCLAVVGHNLQDETKKDWSEKSHWVIFSIVGSANIWMIWFTISFIENITLATATLSVSLTNILAISKWATFLFKKKTFLMQMQQLTDLNEKFRKLESNQKLFKAQETTLKLESIYCQLTVGTGFAYLLKPLFQMIWQFLMNETVVVQLPYQMKFPFEFQGLLGYLIVYSYGFVVTWFIIFYVPGIDSLFYSFALNVSTHFQILQDIIRAADFKGTESEMCETLAGYAKHHNFLLELSERMRLLFKPVIIVQFLMTSMLVGLIAFQIVTFQETRDLFVLIPNLIFISTVLLQLLIYCYGGEIERHESLQLNWAIQTSKWYNLPPQLRMPIEFIMQRSQNPVVIEAGIYEATLETFMNIVQAAASYITIMQSFN